MKLQRATACLFAGRIHRQEIERSTLIGLYLLPRGKGNSSLDLGAAVGSRLDRKCATYQPKRLSHAEKAKTFCVLHRSRFKASARIADT